MTQKWIGFAFRLLTWSFRVCHSSDMAVM